MFRLLKIATYSELVVLY